MNFKIFVFLLISPSVVIASWNKDLYLNDGVEFVFPTGVHYTLANVYSGVWPIETNNFGNILESDERKIIVNFASVINTLKLANFSVQSKIFGKESKDQSVALSILGTTTEEQEKENELVNQWTQGDMKSFVHPGGDSIASQVGSLVNSIHYENEWAWEWKPIEDKKCFTDSDNIQYYQSQGLMPYYENNAFAAVASLFKGGTGSVVFLKPKNNVTILELMLHPTALTQIFDENFPGWGVKQIKLTVPQTNVETTSVHLDSLIKRGVTESFCNYNILLQKRDEHPYYMGPIVQTNQININDKKFVLNSVTGVTINSEEKYKTFIEKRKRDDNDDVIEEEESDTTTSKSITEEEVEKSIEEKNTKENYDKTESEESKFKNDNIEDDECKGNDECKKEDSNIETTVAIEDENVTVQSEIDNSNDSDASINKSKETSEKSNIQGKSNNNPITNIDEYNFDGPFLWFLHATNEEPLFMGVVESFETYKKIKQSVDNANLSDDWKCPSNQHFNDINNIE